VLQQPEEGPEEGAHLEAVEQKEQLPILHQGKEWQQMLLQHLLQQLHHLEDHQEEGTIEQGHEVLTGCWLVMNNKEEMLCQI
jgi:hypothetical protein